MNDKNMILPEVDPILHKDIVMLECNYTQVLRPKPSGNEELIGLIKCFRLFKVLIVGNRLDEEIDEEFENMLKGVVTEFHDIIYIIVGICDAFKNRIASFQCKENFVFVGFVGNLEGLTSSCNVFLNPRRKGGGFSSKIALIQHIPIITHRDCDVYMWCGDAFAVNDLQNMRETLIRYHNDPEFMNTQIKACEDRCADIFMTEEQSIDNVKAFCDEVKGYM